MLLLSSVDAAAETTWEVLERLGGPSVWGISCAQPANPKSFHTIFSKGSDGRAIRANRLRRWIIDPSYHRGGRTTDLAHEVEISRPEY